MRCFYPEMSRLSTLSIRTAIVSRGSCDCYKQQSMRQPRSDGISNRRQAYSLLMRASIRLRKLERELKEFQEDGDGNDKRVVCIRREGSDAGGDGPRVGIRA